MEPLIRYPIDEGLIQEPFKGLYDVSRSGLDFPLRGGASPSGDLGTIWTKLDRDRIAKFLKDTPRGQSFLRKQEVLQISNPKLQTQQSLPSFKLMDLPGMLDDTRIFNKGRNLLTAIQYSGTGIHVNRAGILPFNPKEKFYADIVGAEKNLQNEEASKINRLLILQQLKLTTAKSKGNPFVSLNDKTFSDFVINMGISLDKNTLFEYLGGPGSSYGIGATTIKRAVDTSAAVNETTTPDGKKLNTLTFTYDKLMAKQHTSKNRTGDNSLITDYGDYREDIDDFSGMRFDQGWGGKTPVVGPNGPIDPTNSNLSERNNRIENRFFGGNGYNGRVDKINTLPLFKYKANDTPWNVDNGKDAAGNNVQDIKGRSQDIIKFVFECISNDNDDETVAMFFRAYLSGISDNNTAQWNGFKYMGRGENFYTYGGADRSIGFSFKIAIGSKDELAITYSKLNYLISQLYPDYNFQNQIMRAPLLKLTIGDYFYRLPGFLESVNVTIDDNSSWEITENYQLPHVVTVQVNYRPILASLPQRGKAGINYSKFIAKPIWDNPKNSPTTVTGFTPKQPSPTGPLFG